MAFILAAAGLFAFAEASWMTAKPYVGHARGPTDFNSEDVYVQCLENSMKVFIPKHKMPKTLSGEQLQLVDPACIASDNGTHFIGHPWLKDCGTTRKYQYDGIVYSNMLISKYPKTNEVNKKCPRIKIKFACFYPFYFAAAVRNVKVEKVTIECEHILSTGPALVGGIVALSKARAKLHIRQRTVQCPLIGGVGPKVGLGIRLKTKLAGFTSKRKTIVCKELTKQGNYLLQMRVFSDERFSIPVEGEYQSEKEVVDAFYEIRLFFGDNNVEIMPSTCYATPGRDPNDRIKYFFLKNGCLLDDTVQFYVSGPRNTRFSIKSFTFAKSESTSFFIHCQVDVCVLNDMDSLCRQRCRDDDGLRRKRNNIGWNLRVDKKETRAPDVTSICLDGKMKIALKKQFYPGLDGSLLHLHDVTCLAKDNGTHYIFYNDVNGCGATRTDIKSDVIYRNMVYLEGDSSLVPFFPIEVSCSFSKALSESARVKFTLEAPRRFFKIINEFPYRMQFKVLVAFDVNQRFTNSPVQIVAKRSGDILDILNEVRANGITMRTKHCAWKTSLFTKKKIQLIHKGCPSSKHVPFYEHSGRMEIVRFLLNSKSIPKGKSAHLICTVIVCSSKDPECTKTCSISSSNIEKGATSRMRRSESSRGVHIQCQQSSMTATVLKSSVPAIDASKLHLRDSSCKAFENETHFIFTTPLGACGTGIIKENNGLVYTNQISQDLSDVIIVRQKLVNIPFRCSYSSRTSASSGQFRLKSPMILLSGSSQGVYEVKVKFFTDSTFTQERTGGLALVDPNDDMYFEVAMATSQPNLAIVLNECYGKPTGSKNEREKYVFIRNGCSVDTTVRQYPSPTSDRARFSIMPFTFTDKPKSSIYISCKVSACNPNNPDERCFTSCLK